VYAALSGYAVIWSVIAVGFIGAHLRVLRDRHRETLSQVAFMVASPFLLFSTVAHAELARLFSEPLAVSAGAIVVAGVSFVLIARLVFRDDTAGTVVGTLGACYTNAGNLGLPVAAYILGDMSWMAPIMLIQTAILQPTAIAILDVANRAKGGRPRRWWYYVSLPVRNPITVGTLAGLVVAETGLILPDLAWQPINMIGNAAIPLMLVAFGISLRLDPPSGGTQAHEVASVVAIKTLWHPLVAWLLAVFVAHLPLHDVLAVVVIAALPSAQNIYVIASQYESRPLLARDSIFWSTLVSVPIILAVSTWLR